MPFFSCYAYYLLFVPSNMCSFIYFIQFIFQSSFRFTAKLSRQYKELPYTSPPQMNSLLHYQCPSPKWYICYNQRTYIDTSLSPKVQFTLGFTLSIVHSMGFDKCVMTRMHPCNIIHNSYTALNQIIF